MDELKSECAIFDELPNEVVSYLYMFCLRMLNRNFRNISGTGIFIINGKLFLTNTIIRRNFASTEVGCNSYRQQCIQPQQWIMRCNSASYSSRRQDYYPHKNNSPKYFFYHQHSQPSLHQNTQLRHHWCPCYTTLQNRS